MEKTNSSLSLNPTVPFHFIFLQVNNFTFQREGNLNDHHLRYGPEHHTLLFQMDEHFIKLLHFICFPEDDLLHMCFCISA